MAGGETPVNDRVELLRRLLTEWYRKGCPWPKQPTLTMFAVKADKEVRPLLRQLIDDLGPDMEIQNLRLSHLLRLRLSDPSAN